jgi:hypothetical protein
MRRITICYTAIVAAGFFTIAHAIAQENVEFATFPSGAHYIKVGSDLYRVYQSTSVRLGAYGFQDQKRISLLGRPLFFSHFGNVKAGDPVAGRLVEINEKTRRTINGNAKLNLKKIEGQVLAKGEKAKTRNLIAAVWTIESPESYLELLKTKYRSGDTYAGTLKDDNFRFIFAVLMTNKYEETTEVTYDVGFEAKNLQAKLDEASAGTFEVKVGPQGKTERTIKLSGPNVIGYQWYAVCWDNKEPVSARLHDFQPSANLDKQRPQNCKTFEESSGSR